MANDAAGTTQAIALDSELTDINPVGAFPEAVLLRNTAVAAGAHITFTARGSTLVSRGAPPANQALGGLLLAGANVPGSTVDATLQNSVVRAERTDGDPAHFDVGAANLASATLDHSSYTDVLTQSGGAVTPPGTAGGVTATPGSRAPRPATSRCRPVRRWWIAGIRRSPGPTSSTSPGRRGRSTGTAIAQRRRTSGRSSGPTCTRRVGRAAVAAVGRAVAEVAEAAPLRVRPRPVRSPTSSLPP